MDYRVEVREFLVSRRANVSPEQAGLASYGRRRRVPGLRREEVAQLAGVSTDYYTRLEKGGIASASEEVLDAVASALQLDESERAHLVNLARAARSPRTLKARASVPTTEQVRPSLRGVVDAMTGAGAFVRNGRMDVLYVNGLGRALWAPLFETAHGQPNMARFVFLDAAGREFYQRWENAAEGVVAQLLSQAGQHPFDKPLTDLIGELATRSEEFRSMWATRNVQLHCAGRKLLRHPVVGELALNFDAFDVPADPGLGLTVYSPEPNSDDADKLSLLASWSVSELRATETEPEPHTA